MSLKRIPGVGKSGTSRMSPDELGELRGVGCRSRGYAASRRALRLGRTLGLVAPPGLDVLWTARGAPGSSAPAAPARHPTPLGASSSPAARPVRGRRTVGGRARPGRVLGDVGLGSGSAGSTQVDQQRGGDEDRGVGAGRDADEQRQRDVLQGARPEQDKPMTRIDATGSSATTEVLIERTRVWLTARFAAWSRSPVRGEGLGCSPGPCRTPRRCRRASTRGSSGSRSPRPA